QAERTLRGVLDSANRLGLAGQATNAQQNLAVALTRLGRLGEARELLEATVAAYRRQRSDRMEAGSQFYLTMLHTDAGDFARAAAGGGRAWGLAKDIPPPGACALAALSRALGGAGRPADALAAAAEAQAILNRLGGIEEGEGLIRIAYAEALRGAGRVGEAEA